MGHSYKDLSFETSIGLEPALMISEKLIFHKLE